MEPILPSVAEITVAYVNKTHAAERLQINSSQDAYNCLLKGYNPDTLGLQEQFVVLFLDQGNKVLGLYKLATGGRTGVISDPRLIFGVALKIAAVAIIVSHSHPSGIMRPSNVDTEMTRKLKEGGRLLDIRVLDHLIISTCSSYFSFADEGLL